VLTKKYDIFVEKFYTKTLAMTLRNVDSKY